MAPRLGFSLIELLVAVGIIALLAAVLLPALSAARQTAGSAVCLSNLKEAFTACRVYADAHRGFGPAIGEPYNDSPNWGLVVLRSGMAGGSVARFRSESVLVCPAIQRFYGQEMSRTYAMNATGHAGLPGDPDNYDDPQIRGHIRFDRIRWPAGVVLLMDSARTSMAGSGPPSTRSASVVDFRQAEHVNQRLDWFHAGGRGFNAAALDGSVALQRQIRTRWQQPLP